MKKYNKDLMGINTYNKCYNIDILKRDKHINNKIKLYDMIVQTSPPQIVEGLLKTAFYDDEIPSLLSLLPYYEMHETEDEDEEKTA